MSEEDWIEMARQKVVAALGEISEDTDLFTVLDLAAVRIKRLQKELNELKENNEI